MLQEEKQKKLRINRVLRSSGFFQLSIFLLIIGSIWWGYFTFFRRVDTQDEILRQLQENSQQVQDLKSQISQLRDSNDNLTKGFCVLKDQIEKLGVEPAVNGGVVCSKL